MFRKFFLPTAYFKIIAANGRYLCYTDNSQDVRVDDTKVRVMSTDADNLLKYPGDTGWDWLDDYELLTDMCRIYLDDINYTPYDLLREIRYNNIDSILQNAFKFDASSFSEYVYEVGHYDRIGPRKDVYGIVGKYSGIDRIEQKPIAGYLQAYTADGWKDGAYTSPWSPTARNGWQRVADFCET